MTATLETCLNCDTPLLGVWCSTCGQANRRERLDVNDLAHDAVDQFIGLDTRVGHTLVDFSLRPGRSALAYVRGHRARYVNPLKYMIFAVALYLLAMNGFGIRMSEFTPQASPPPGRDPVALELMQAFQDIAQDGLRTILFTAPPVFAWICGAFLGRRRFRIGIDGGWADWTGDFARSPRRFNFVEGCSLWFHVFAHAILLFTLPALCLVALGFKAAIFWILIPTVAYYVWSAHDFYGRGWLYTGCIVLFAYVAFQVLFMVSLVISLLVAVMLSS